MKALKFLVLFVLFLSCREDNVDTSNIIGTWKLTAQLVDPGDGSGKYIPVNSTKTITFKTDGNFSSNGSLCTMTIEANENSTGTYTYNSTEKVMTPLNCIGLNITVVKHGLKIENGELIISNFGCIEPCAQKFTKIQD